MLFQTVQTGESLFWQGLVFSGIAAGITALAIWWIFFSRVRPLANPVKAAVSGIFMTRMALLIGLSGLARYAGSVWDISEHIVQGVVPGGDDFLWPPHLVIYFSFLLSLGVALFSILRISQPYRARKIFDPRYAIRDYPYLGAIVIAGLYAWMSVPGDALWHELYGFELTAWSPPHVMLIVASAVETLSAAALLINAEPGTKPTGWKSPAAFFIVAIALNESYVIATTDWEAAIPSGTGLTIINSRAFWLFPVVAAAVAFLLFIFARELTGNRFAGTYTAAAFYIIRLIGMGWMTSAGGVPLRFPLIFIGGIFLVEWFAASGSQNSAVRRLVLGAVFSAAYYTFSYPIIQRLGSVFTITPADYVIGFLITALVSALLLRSASGIGALLARGRLPAPQSAPQPAPQPAPGD